VRGLRIEEGGDHRLLLCYEYTPFHILQRHWALPQGIRIIRDDASALRGLYHRFFMRHRLLLLILSISLHFQLSLLNLDQVEDPLVLHGLIHASPPFLLVFLGEGDLKVLP
jgi:hypothetical protein